MQYANVTEGIFLRRPNRFLAFCLINGKEVPVHVKNTGRCRELLLPGSRVWCAPAANSDRKTAWDLISVEKTGLGIVNVDSLAPNKVVGEWLSSQSLVNLRSEFSYESSRFDFYFEHCGKSALLEVKGCTLERDGIGYFPDAPTERGARHLRTLAAAVLNGFAAYIAYVIPMPGVTRVLPNTQTDSAYSEAFAAAVSAGVVPLYLPCAVAPDSLFITAPPFFKVSSIPERK